VYGALYNEISPTSDAKWGKYVQKFLHTPKQGTAVANRISQILANISTEFYINGGDGGVDRCHG